MAPTEKGTARSIRAASGSTPACAERYENLALTRADDGVLVLRVHTDGGPIFTGQTHQDFPAALEEISLDRQNKALVIASTSDSFTDQIGWPMTLRPCIPTTRSSRTSTSRRSARAMATSAIPPSASPAAMGGTSCGKRGWGRRGAKWLLWTREPIDAQTALQWGAVSEVVAHERVLERRIEIARSLAAKPPLYRTLQKQTLNLNVRRRIVQDVRSGWRSKVSLPSTSPTKASPPDNSAR